MTRISTMLETCPKDLGGVDREKLATCIAAVNHGKNRHIEIGTGFRYNIWGASNL